jgi:hypothetical protein
LFDCGCLHLQARYKEKAGALEAKITELRNRVTETKREMELRSLTAVQTAEAKFSEQLDEKSLAILKLEEEVFK